MHANLRHPARSATITVVAAAILFAACATTPASPGVTPGGPGRVTLTTASNSTITIDVVDGSGTVVAAASGEPGDGATVEPYTVAVANHDATTLSLHWVGGPCDLQDTLMVDPTGRRLLIVEPECTGDSIVFDRILLVTFSAPVSAGDIEARLQDGMDTSDLPAPES